MKTISCHALSGQTCNFVAKGETAEEAKNDILHHGMTVHPEMMAKMTDEDKKKMELEMNEMLK